MTAMETMVEVLCQETGLCRLAIHEILAIGRAQGRGEILSECQVETQPTGLRWLKVKTDRKEFLVSIRDQSLVEDDGEAERLAIERGD